MSKNYITIKNTKKVKIAEVPVVSYDTFFKEVDELLQHKENHCITYFGYDKDENTLTFLCGVANDEQGDIRLLSYELNRKEKNSLKSLTALHFSMHIFEREICENWDVNFENHPWLKPVRYAHNRADKNKVSQNYPYYKIGGNELHEVGVGPIHAGVIEPGHFRFLCNGEMVLHLEIQLGWQHRGIEALLLNKSTLLQQTLLAESISGDTAIGHATAFAQTIESLGNIELDKNVAYERAIALELERIAIHVGDLSAMCTDVAYQLGSAAFGALRTPVINFTQAWCGNRFGKSLIRVGGSNYSLTKELKSKLKELLLDFEWRFNEIADRTFSLPSIIKRFESIGAVSKKQVALLGGVGMVAKMAGIPRDVRASHPFGAYKELNYQPVLQETGDVMARGMIRRLEIIESIKVIQKLLEVHQPSSQKPVQKIELAKSAQVVSMTEGWRGEICHVATTDENGKLKHYKIKDPSMHNWKSLELSLRNLEISDFPINNKSYDLSYCGHDL